MPIHNRVRVGRWKTEKLKKKDARLNYCMAAYDALKEVTDTLLVQHNAIFQSDGGGAPVEPTQAQVDEMYNLVTSTVERVAEATIGPNPNKLLSFY